MGLFTMHNCYVSWLLNFLKLKLDSQSRSTIPEFSGYHCNSSSIRGILIKIQDFNLTLVREKKNKKELKRKKGK